MTTRTKPTFLEIIAYAIVSCALLVAAILGYQVITLATLTTDIIAGWVMIIGAALLQTLLMLRGVKA